MPTPAINSQIEVLKSLPVNQFKTNSAQIEVNDVFVCREGISHDGHSYAQQAVGRGAVAVIANRPLDIDIPVIMTDSYYQSLALVKAYYGHPHQKIKHIGVTGTNGKTTVSHCLNQILNQTTTSAYIGTLGAKLAGSDYPLENTTPDGVTLLNLFHQMAQRETEFNLMELSSHALAQDRAGFVSLQIGIITNIGRDHLDYHKTKDAYVQAKLQLIDRIAPNGTAVINLDDPHAAAAIERASGRVNVVTFGIENAQAHVFATNVRTTRFGSCFELRIDGECFDVNSQMPFTFNVENALAIAASLLSLGWQPSRIAAALQTTVAPDGRAQFLSLNNGATGLVDYAHNADGLSKLLEDVRPYTKGRLIVVTGVTGDRIQDASGIGVLCSQLADTAVFTSDNPMGVDQEDIFRALTSQVSKVPHFEISDRAEAIEFAKQLSVAGDLIVVCGKGSETHQYISNGKGDRQQYIGDLAALSSEVAK